MQVIKQGASAVIITMTTNQAVELKKVLNYAVSIDADSNRTAFNLSLALEATLKKG